MSPVFLALLQSCRDRLQRALTINSGFRCPDHNNRVSATGRDGPHTTGRAADIECAGDKALELWDVARELGATGFGPMQRGPHDERYLHIDDLPPAPGQPRPWIWTY